MSSLAPALQSLTMKNHFEDSRISADVQPHDALRFLWDNGIFYQEDESIGTLVEELRPARLDLRGAEKLRSGMMNVEPVSLPGNIRSSRTNGHSASLEYSNNSRRSPHSASQINQDGFTLGP